METQLATVNVNAQLLEKVITNNDFAGLTSIEKVQHIKNVCNSLGLNPLTKPIQLIKFQGKEIAYFTKDATEQLRKNNKVSIEKIDTKMIDGGIYVVTAYAMTPDGRRDSSTGVISISGLKGDALGNAMMKAETKAKRRVTLSICGLGFLDESEIESLPKNEGSYLKTAIEKKRQEVKAQNLLEEKVEKEEKEKVDGITSEFIYDIDDILLEISQFDDIKNLQDYYSEQYKIIAKARDKVALAKLMKAKDAKKESLLALVKEFNDELNAETGEIVEQRDI